MINKLIWRLESLIVASARASLLSGAAMIVLAACAVRAQSPADTATSKFEVASIKPCKADQVGARGGGGGGSSADRLNLNCQTVRRIIEMAYSPRTSPSSVPIDGGPAWIDSDGYTIEAKAEGNPGQAMMAGPMLQTLLEDRFKLKIHRESREIPVYALTLAKGGLHLRPSEPGSCVPVDYALPAPHPQFCGTPKRGDPGFHLIGATMADLCWVLSAPEISDRKTIDQTGITGMFDIQLLGPGELNRAAHDGDSPGGTGTDYFAALREAVQKLGLNLERAKGSGEFIVIDRVERPSEN
jgi:uncharacterized protein (TIGR03435 family)